MKKQEAKADHSVTKALRKSRAKTAAGLRERKKEAVLGLTAKEEAERDLLSIARSVGLTEKSVFRTIAEGLKSRRNEARFSERTQSFQYSKAMKDNTNCLKAADLGATVLGLKPKDEKDSNRVVRIVVESNV